MKKISQHKNLTISIYYIIYVLYIYIYIYIYINHFIAQSVSQHPPTLGIRNVGMYY